MPSTPADRQTMGPRASLPGGRAVVGGLLVTLAAVGTFAAYAAASAPPSTMYVVAARTVPAGRQVHADDFRLVALDLTAEVAAQLFTSVDDLDGAVALATLEPDQPVGRAAVLLAPAGEQQRSHELSFSVERDRALDGRIQRGEDVDLIATYGAGDSAYTLVVARHLPVLAVEAQSKGVVGAAGRVTVTVALDGERQVLEVAHAIEIAKVTLARSTRAGEGDGDGTADQPYTAPGADDRP